MNAKLEFLEHVKDRVLKCAKLEHYPNYKANNKTFILKVGYSETQLTDFLQSIDFEYDDGYGSQELFGNIWYEDGTWSEREEYDGSEWWVYKQRPEITGDLK